jgi:hypothetical protein
MPLFTLPWTFPSDPMPAYSPTVSTFGSLTYNATHVTDGVALLLQQFQGLPYIEGLIESFMHQIQDVEAALWQILQATDLDLCENSQLDGVGDLVGEERRGRTDAIYRAAIRVRILINQSDGTHADLLKILTTYLGIVSGAGTVELNEPAPAALALYVYTLPADTRELRVVARTIKPSGVNLDGRVETSATRAARFGWDSGSVSGQTINNWFGWDGDASVGGLFATEI